MQVQKYSKAIAFLVAMVAAYLVEADVVSVGELSSTVERGLELLAFLGVLIVPNKGYDGKW